MILPQIADNRRWKKEMAKGAHRDMILPPRPPDPEAERIRARKERKAKKRAKRLGRAIAGQFTRSTRSAA